MKRAYLFLFGRFLSSGKFFEIGMPDDCVIAQTQLAEEL